MTKVQRFRDSHTIHKPKGLMMAAMKRNVGSAAVAAVLALTLVGCGDGGATSATSTPPVITVSAPATPNYKIIAKTTNQRFDHKPNYYIVIDPVDVSTDSFKQTVKLVLRAVARTNGGDPNFSADVFDDESTANTAYSYDTSNGIGVNASDLKAQADQEKQHCVAMYNGGVNNEYEIAWYPENLVSSPNVGKYVSYEQWKP